MKTKARPSVASGFSLIESLVALVVLSLGLLGFAAMLLGGLQSNQSAQGRSDATILSYDIIDAMRANKPSALAGAYNLSTSVAMPSGTTPAARDLIRWTTALTKRFPSAATSAVITVDGTTGVATVSIEWDDRLSTNSSPSSPLRFVVRTRL